MALKPPAIQAAALTESGHFSKTWLDWFRSITRESKDGYTGTFDIANGDTVTVVNGKITSVD